MNTETCEKVAAFTAALFGLATCSAITPIAAALGGAAAVLSVPSIIRSIGASHSDGIAGRTVKRLAKGISADWRTWTARSGEFSEDQVTIAAQALDEVVPLIEVSPSELISVGRDLRALAELAAGRAKIAAPGLYDVSHADPQSSINLSFLKSIVLNAAETLEGDPDFEASVAPWFQREVIGRFASLEEKTSNIPSRTAELVSKQTASMLAERLGISLRTGAAPLDPSRVRARPTELLVARYEVTPFIDRGRILEEMMDWAIQERDERVRGRLVVASGGRGKTRLGIEILRRLQSRGWVGTFLSSRNSGTNSVDAIRALLDAPQISGVCVVVDYAESQQELLRTAANAACSIAEHGSPVRILALARSDLQWWGSFSRDEAASRVFELAPIDDLSLDMNDRERDELFATSQEAFRASLLAHEVPVFGSANRTGFNQARSPLDIAVAAYLGVRGYRLASGESLFETLYQEERLHWRRALGVSTDDAPEINDLARIVAQVTLVQGAREQGARALMEADTKPRKADPEDLLKGLHRLYDRPITVTSDGQDRDEPMIGGLQPDRLGEHVTMTVLAGDHDHLAQNTLLAAFDIPPFFGVDVDRVLTTCRRSLRPEHDSIVSNTAQQTINSFADIVDSLPLHRAKTLFHAMPLGQSMGLAELAVAITKHISALTPDDTSHLSMSERALYLQKMAQRLGYSGKFVEAIDPITAANELTVQLADASAEYSPQRARVLNDFGYHLSNVGRFQEAYAAGQESVRIYRDLIRGNRGEFVEALALGLNNVAFHASNLGMGEEAVAVSAEAVKAFEALSPAALEEVAGDHALSVFNLADHQWRTNAYGKAVETVERALKLYQTLADTDHDIHGSMLAGTYSLQSIILWDLARNAEAIESIGSTIRIRRELFDSSPGYFLLPLSISLIRRSKYTLATNPREALKDAQEAATLLYDDRSVPWLSHSEKLVEAHLHAALALMILDRRKEARAALKLARERCDADPSRIPEPIQQQLLDAEKQYKKGGSRGSKRTRRT